ncbi:MAG TPA: squalene/phytoene synthase family protein [Anaerolineales bacterium]
MDNKTRSSEKLAIAITKLASKQTYYTIRFFADRDRVADAYRAYGYFRWVDDVIDDVAASSAERIAFVHRQKSLLEAGYRSERIPDLCPEEWMLVDLIHSDHEKNSGLRMYLRQMMDVMIFDAERGSRLISQSELSEYTRKLATAVTEAMYYFIGHDDPSPRGEARYMAVTAAHVTHMLRDALEDVENGYINIPREVLASRGISPREVTSSAYRQWVCERVQFARKYFEAARGCTAQVRNLRCRLAGFAYTARFEWMLGAIERDCYCLRREYPERKSWRAGLWMAWSTLTSVFAFSRLQNGENRLAPQPVRIGKR